MLIVQEEEILAYKYELRDERYKSAPLLGTLQDHLNKIRSYKPSDTISANSLLYTLDFALRNPKLVEVHILSTYITELIRILINLGVGSSFAGYLDKAIQCYHDLGLSTLDLYLAKVTYLGLINIESSERKKAIDIAIGYAQTPEDKIKCLIALAHYYNDSSQYSLSIETCQRCLGLVVEHQNLVRYHIEVLVILGMNYFYLFDYHNAKAYFEKALELVKPQDISNFQDAPLGVYGHYHAQTALHYLGRVYAAEGNLSKALDYYVNVLLHDYEHNPEALGEIAFNHLRIGELLISVNLIHQAYDHLKEAQESFNSLQSSSSSQVQVDLAFADIYIKQKNHQRAEQAIRNAIDFARKTGFPRGELQGLEKLFWFQLRRLRFHHAAYTFYQAIKTLQGGEIERQGSKLLKFYLRQVPKKLLKTLQGSSYDVFVVANPNEKIETCVCPIHLKNNAN